MKKFFQKILNKLVKKSVSEVVENMPAIEVETDSKKEFWKFVLQTLISILTAILTALGATSCMGIH